MIVTPNGRGDAMKMICQVVITGNAGDACTFCVLGKPVTPDRGVALGHAYLCAHARTVGVEAIAVPLGLRHYVQRVLEKGGSNGPAPA